MLTHAALLTLTVLLIAATAAWRWARSDNRWLLTQHQHLVDANAGLRQQVAHGEARIRRLRHCLSPDDRVFVDTITQLEETPVPGGTP